LGLVEEKKGRPLRFFVGVNNSIHGKKEIPGRSGRLP